MLARVDDVKSFHRDANCARRYPPRLDVKPVETSRQKTTLTIFSALLISGLAVQTVAASEHHSRFRRAYNQVTSEPTAPPIRYMWENNGPGVGLKDLSRVGGEDPSFRPSGS